MRVPKVKYLIFAGLLAVASHMPAQQAPSAILGRVTDPSGSAIVGATVGATNTATGVHTTSPTNATGDFLLPFLIPGPYSLTVEAPGFKKSLRSQIQVRVDAARVNKNETVS
jgi:hypothetical protein